MPLLTVNLLGKPQLLIDGQHPCVCRVRKAEAMLFYCVLSPRPVITFYLRDLLWPDIEEKKASHNFNDAFYALKKGLQAAHAPEAILNALHRSKQGTIEFDRQSGYICDVEVFTDIVTNATSRTDVQTLQKALALYRGPFLEHFVIHEAPDYDAWTESKRQSLVGAYRKLLHLLSTRYLTAGAWPEAIQCLERLRVELAEEYATSEQEVIYGLLMMCHALTARLDLAREVYTEYVQSQPTAPGSHSSQQTLDKLHKIIQTYQPSNLRIKTLVAEAIQRIGHRTTEPRLQDALLSIYLATGAQRAPAQGPIYRTVLRRAQEEATRHGATLIGTPHLALALCDLTAAEPSPIRDAFPCSLVQVAQTIRMALGQGIDHGRPPTEYTLTLQHVLQLAADVAGAGRGHTIEIEMLHCWFALLKEEQGLLSQVLEQGEVDRLAVLEQIEEDMG